MRVLQICLRSPYPPRDGGAIAMESLGNSLIENGAEVQILAFNTRKHYVDANRIPSEFKKQFKPVFVDLDASVTIFGVLHSLFSKKSYNIARFDVPQMHSMLESVLKQNAFDCVLIESLFMLPYVPTIRKHTKSLVFYRAHNIEHQIWRRMALQSVNPLKKWYFGFLALRLEQYERHAIRMVDAVLPLTAIDASWFQTSGFSGEIKTIPVGLKMENYQVPASTKNLPHVFHVGSMDWLPNVEGVTWLVNQVWPLVIKSCPDAKLFLAGKGMPQHLMRKSEDGIHVSGYVDNLIQFMDGKQIMVVPLFSGSGMRVKILEGMAASRTIVSTTVGSEGIEVRAGHDMLLADDAVGFAANIIRCIQNPEDALVLAANGKALVMNQYDSLKIGKHLIDFISDFNKVDA